MLLGIGPSLCWPVFMLAMSHGYGPWTQFVQRWLILVVATVLHLKILAAATKTRVQRL